jgi:EAL domain-containing protein (putative c-di-GMP-specific phosphodiesterase class I)/thiamine transporter ThiT
MRKFFDEALEVLIHPASHAKIVLTVIMILMIPSTYLLVYLTGGIKFVYSHTMYVPIVVLAILYGAKGGLLAALIGGILLGPLMPIDVVSGEDQVLINWLYRLLIFLVIGGVVGTFASWIRKQTESIRQLALINPETEIPIFTSINQTFTDEEYIERYHKNLYVFQITNDGQVIELLGKKIYNDLIIIVSKELNKHFEQNIDLFQIDTSRFIVLVKKTYKDDFSDALLKFFDSAFTIDNIPIHLAVVVGISASSKSVFTKVDEAVLAINHAKKNHLQVFQYSKAIRPTTFDVSIVGSFKNALEEGQLFLVYHPIHEVKTKRVVSVESLIRWQHPKHGLLTPDAFISLIENTQLINHLSGFVLENAFQTMEKLDQDIAISINLSARNFYSRFFIKNAHEIIDKYEELADRMIFEITESVLMEHPRKSIEIMNNFRNRGIRFAIDDFGTGYSSLAYINLFPIDHIKIDRFFIGKMEEETVYKIIQSTVGLAHELNLTVVAEGVETKKSQTQLASLSCDLLQGFVYTKPLNEEDLIVYLEKQEKTSS